MRKIFVYLFLATAFITQSYSQILWTKDPENPVLKRGANGTWDDVQVGSPFIIYDGALYHMWYNGNDGSNTNIGYASSTDRIDWVKHPTPVLNHGSAGSWDNLYILHPTVYFDGNTYHMWYTGSNGSVSQIGYATSPDSINWTKYSGNPVLPLGEAGSWDDQNVNTPEVLFIDGVFHMWYAGFDGGHEQIGHATSHNGIDWEKDTLNPVLKVGMTGSWDNANVSQPSVLFDGTMFHMWYGGGSDFSWKIGYAYSVDGRIWQKDETNNPVLGPGLSGQWDGKYVGYQTVCFSSDSTNFYMWYTAAASAGYVGDIGLAKAPNVTPVELTSFTALAKGKEIILNWSTATEINNHGFEIQRSISGKEFLIVGFIDGYGTTSEQHNYSYTDKNLDNGKYFYRLKQVDFDGSYEYSNVVDVELRALNSYILEQNYPNPFNPATTIRFSVPEKSNVNLTVLNSIGEQVALILNENKEPGFYQVEFNAANLSSGVYFYQLHAGNFVKTKKMILMK